MGLAMVVVGAAAVVIMNLLPADRMQAVGALGLSAALGLGVGSAWLVRAVRPARGGRRDEDLVRLIDPVFDDAYVLLLSPKLPDVHEEVAGLLVGPPGIRVLVARRWHGTYRVRGRGWEFDTRDSRRRWIPCRTNPSFDADAAADAVARWARGAADEAGLPIVPAVVFPRAFSSVILEEPDCEVVTKDNAPWWGQRIGRLQRMDAPRVGRFVEAVISAGDGFEPLAQPAEEKGVGG